MLVLIGICVPITSAGILSIEDGWVAQAGDSTQVNIWLDEAPEGLSGFNITIDLLDPSIGEITDITFPGWANPTDNSSVPASSVWMKAVDLNEQFPPPSYDIPFGTLTLKGTSVGITGLNITITKLDDFSGNASYPEIMQGNFTVGEPPIADFVPNQTQGFSPLMVNFTDLSVGSPPLAYEWDFGDGSGNVTETDPEHVFTATVNTTYTVILTVSNPLGESSVTADITVNVTPPIANFTANQTAGFSPLPVQFTDLSIGTPPLAYQWDFGDGSGNVTDTNPEHLFTTTVNETFLVVLTVTNDAGSDSMAMPITVNVTPPPKPPVANFIVNQTEGFSPLPVQFTDLSIGTPPLAYQWDFGDESGNVTEKNPAHLFVATVNTTYIVTLTVSNDLGNSSISTDITVNVTPPVEPPVANFTADQTAGFSPLPVQFTDHSTGTLPLVYEWDFGDGSDNSTEINPEHLFTTTVNETFFVLLTVTNEAGYDSISMPITVNVTPPIEPPIADFTPNVTEGFAPLTVRFTDHSTGTPPLAYEWDFGDGSPFSYGQDAEHTFTTNANRTFLVTLTVTNEAGSNAKSLPITVNVQPPPTATITGWVATGSGAGAAYVPGARVRIARSIADLNSAVTSFEGIADQRGIYHIDDLPTGVTLYATVLSPAYASDRYYERPIQYQVNWRHLITYNDPARAPALQPLAPDSTTHIVWFLKDNAGARMEILTPILPGWM